MSCDHSVLSLILRIPLSLSHISTDVFSMLTLDGRNDLPSSTMTSGFAALNKPTNSIVNSASHTSRMSTSASISESLNSPYKHIWIVTGPAGCGKSTIAAFLAKELGISYIEGDDVSHTIPPHWTVRSACCWFTGIPCQKSELLSILLKHVHNFSK